jgi:hypothetical protein
LGCAEGLQLIALIWVRFGPRLTGEDGYGSRKAGETLGQSSADGGTLDYVAIANTVVGADAPGCCAGDVDAGDRKSVV